MMTILRPFNICFWENEEHLSEENISGGVTNARTARMWLHKHYTPAPQKQRRYVEAAPFVVAATATNTSADLKQEFHGYCHGLPINYGGKNNLANN